MQYSDAIIIFGAPETAHEVGQKILRHLEEEADARIGHDDAHMGAEMNRGARKPRQSDPHY